MITNIAFREKKKTDLTILFFFIQIITILEIEDK